MTNSVAPLSPGRQQFFDANGDPVVGGTVGMYIPSTLTTKQTWSDSAGTVLNTNPITLDDLGSAAIWGSGFYRQILEDSAGNLLWDVVTLAVQLGAGVGELFLDTVASLEAANIAGGTTNLTLSGYYTAGDGGGGQYIPASAGAGAGKVQSADGAWWILASNPVNVRQFGAKGDGTTNDAASFSAAVAWANGRGTTGETGITGTTIQVPDGRYLISTSLSAVTVSGVRFVGDSREGAIILHTAGIGVLSTWSGASGSIFGGGWSDVKVECPGGSPSVGDYFVSLAGTEQTSFDNIRTEQIGQLALLGTVSAPAASTKFINVIGNCANIAAAFVNCAYGSVVNFDGLYQYVKGVATPTANRTSAMTTAAGRYLIQADTGSWDTITFSGACLTSGFYDALHVVANGIIVQNIWANDSIFDYNANDVFHLDSEGVSGGIFNVNSGKTYANAWSGSAVNMICNNANRGHDFSGLQVAVSGLDGIAITGSGAGTAAGWVNLNGVNVGGANRLATPGTSSAVTIQTGTEITMVGAIGGYDTTSAGFPWQPQYGVSVAAGLDNYTITECRMFGVTLNFNIATDSLGSRLRLVTNNPTADYSGFQSSGIFVMPATTVPFTNKSPWKVTIYVGAGSITGIFQDGAELPFAGAATLVLEPGETYSATYTGSPAASYYVWK